MSLEEKIAQIRKDFLRRAQPLKIFYETLTLHDTTLRLKIKARLQLLDEQEAGEIVKLLDPPKSS